MDAQPLTQHEMQQEIWRQRQKLRKKESQQAYEREQRRKQRETNVLNKDGGGEVNIPTIKTPKTGMSRRQPQNQQQNQQQNQRQERRAVAPGPPKIAASPARRNNNYNNNNYNNNNYNNNNYNTNASLETGIVDPVGSIPRLVVPVQRGIDENGWDDEIRKAQGIRAANRGQHTDVTMGKPKRQEPPSPRSGRRQRQQNEISGTKETAVGGNGRRKRRDNTNINNNNNNNNNNNFLVQNNNGGNNVRTGKTTMNTMHAIRSPRSNNSNSNNHRIGSQAETSPVNVNTNTTNTTNTRNNNERKRRSNRPEPLQLNNPNNQHSNISTSNQDVFGYHPGIPERGGTALMAELNQLGLGGLQQKTTKFPRSNRNSNNHTTTNYNYNQAWNPRNGSNSNSKQRKLLEIKEVASFQYGAHGSMVPVGTDDATALYGPMSPLSRHIHMQEMRSQMGPVSKATL